MPETVPPPVKTNDGLLCGLGGCDYIAKSPQAMGMHRWHVHQIPGQESKRKRVKDEVQYIKGDDIVNIVLSQLFPNGIPVAKVRAVLSWAQHTDDFMEELRA